MTSEPKQDVKVARRSFLKASVAAAGTIGGALGGAGCATTWPTARPRPGKVIGANDRIRLGLIGCGGLGYSFHIPKLLELTEDKSVNVELAAVCDIYEPRKQRAKERSGAELFHDYRKMLDRADIDGVVIVTPDHWHARMSMDAMEAGKDIHVEKPMTLYWEEARQVYETATRLGRVVQVGAEGASRDIYWQARRVVESGELGKIVWATGGVYRNDPKGDWNYPIAPECTPKTLDWDAFLGPAPRRPFSPERYFRYRKYWDYSGGVAHDLLAHVLSSLHTTLGAEFPTRVSAAGGIYVHHDRETPDTFSMQVEYPSQYLVTMFCTQATEQGVELAVRGEKGTIRFTSTWHQPRRVVVSPEAPFKDQVAERTIDEEPRIDHDRNFVQCMRTRAKPHYDVLSGYKAMVALDLANRSWREGKMFTFDEKTQRAIS